MVIINNKTGIEYLFFEFNESLICNNYTRDTIKCNVENIIKYISKLKHNDQIKYTSDLILMIVQKRAIRMQCSEGKRLLSYWLLVNLYFYFPENVLLILQEMPYYGYWGDLNNLYEIISDDIKLLKDTDIKTKNTLTNLLDSIIDIWCVRIDKDKQILNKLNPTHLDTISLISKWLPREKGALNKNYQVLNHLLKKYDPLLWSKNRNKCKKNYRNFISECNKKLNTTEILMCNKKYSLIDFNNVPKKCLYKNHNVWLDENKFGKRKNIDSFDRCVARYNYLNYINNTENHINYKNYDCNILEILKNKDYIPYRNLIINNKSITEYYKRIDVKTNYNADYLKNILKQVL